MRRVDELVDARRRRRRRPARSRRQRAPMPSRERVLGRVGVDDDEPPRPRVVRRRREARGLDDRVEVGARSTGSGRNARIDRRASTKRGNDAHRNRSSFGGRISSRTEPSREPRRVEAAHDRDRHARRLAHHELGGRRDLVGDRDLGDLQHAPERVGRVAQVDDGRDAAHADRDVGEAAAATAGRTCRTRSPRRRPARGRAARRGRASPNGRSRRAAARPSPASTFERSMPGVRAHEAVPGLADDEVAAPAHDAHRLRLDERAARVEIVGVERHEAALGLRHDLLGDDEAVAVGERRALRARPRRR